VKTYTFVDYATQAYSAFVALLLLCFHGGRVVNWEVLVLAHTGGILLTHLLIKLYFRFPSVRLLDFLRHFYPVLFYTWFFCETSSLSPMFSRECFDPIVIHVEQALFGGQPGVSFMDKLPYVWISEIFYTAYFSYYVMIAGVGIALFIRDRRQFFHYVSVVSFVFYVCYLFYIFFPVIGPRLFFHGLGVHAISPELMATGPIYPGTVQNGPAFHLMAWIYENFESPGAAFPSSHVAVAITTLVFSFLYLPRIRHIHLVATILLCLSTVYCRYHYGTDVIGGAIMAAVLVPAGNWLYFKFRRPALEQGLVLAGART
jgi:membrane-associated phospholipid phosphatase